MALQKGKENGSTNSTRWQPRAHEKAAAKKLRRANAKKEARAK